MRLITLDFDEIAVRFAEGCFGVSRPPHLTATEALERSVPEPERSGLRAGARAVALYIADLAATAEPMPKSSEGLQ